jgi:hypothetical protein
MSTERRPREVETAVQIPPSVWSVVRGYDDWRLLCFVEFFRWYLLPGSCSAKASIDGRPEFQRRFYEMKDLFVQTTPDMNFKVVYIVYYLLDCIRQCQLTYHIHGPTFYVLHRSLLHVIVIQS